MSQIYKQVQLWIIVIILMGMAVEVSAQSKTGTTIGQFLKIEPGARNAALGSASVSMYGEAMAAFYNPASLGRLADVHTQFTHSEWLADINYNYLIVGVPLGGLGSFMAQATSLNSGEIDVRTVEQPLGTGERYSVTNFSLGAGYGRMLTNRVSIGAQVNYVQETIWNSTLKTFAFNFGVQYQLSSGGIMLGASLLNFGPRAGYNGRDLYINYDFDPDKYGDNDQLPAALRTGEYLLPTSFRFGMTFPYQFTEGSKLIVAADALHPNDNKESLNVGAELQLLGNAVALRGGYRNLFLEDAEGGLVLGAGANIPLGSYKLGIDYAWADYGRLENAQRFTLGFRF